MEKIPSSIGKTTRSKISKQGVVSNKRKRNYKKPNTTQRKGLLLLELVKDITDNKLLKNGEGNVR